MKTKLLLSLLLAIYGMAALAQTEQMEYRPFAISITHTTPPYATWGIRLNS